MASPQLCDQVLVTLTLVQPTSTTLFPTRRILLTKTNPTMPIGRTSRRNSNLAASETNAWIDSAVMSRDHAELRLDANSQELFIKDIGSLHGTFVNDTRLGPNQWQAVKHGDLVRFGIPIERGADTFPPCVMKATVQFSIMKTFPQPIVFKVPDDSDEEEDLSDVGDNVILRSAQILRDNQIHPANGHDVPSASSFAIDLTNQDERSQSPLPIALQSDRNSPPNEDFPISIRSSLDKQTSEIPHSRIPTPPETGEAFDGACIISEDSDAWDDVSEANDESSSADDNADETMRDCLFDDDDEEDVEDKSSYSLDVVTVSNVRSEFDASRLHGNNYLPPILDYSKGPSFSDPVPPSDLRLPSLYETIQAQVLFMPYEKMDGPAERTEIETGGPSMIQNPDLDSSKVWEEEMAHEPANKSHSLSDPEHMLPPSLAKEFCVSPPAVITSIPNEISGCKFEMTTEVDEIQRCGNLVLTADTDVRAQEEIPKKRKASEISLAPEEDIEITTSSSSGSHQNSTERRPQQITPDVFVSRAKEPPTKRLRKAVEILGYAALGGVVVVSALIATAPAL